MPRRSTPEYSEGFSLVELMVAITVALFVTAGVLTLALTSKSLFDSDSARTRINQNLSATRDLVVADVRKAGERLGSDFPAIEIVDGALGAPDQLVVRRNLVDVVLPVCATVSGSTTSIKIADDTPPPPDPPAGCTPLSDDDTDGWPDNLQAWRDYRTANGATVKAYIYNPTTKLGEFFEYVQENEIIYDITAGAGTFLTNTYPDDSQSRIYILEERRYDLGNGVLRMIVNEDAVNPINITNDMEDFQAVAVFQDGSQQNSLGAADVWSDLASIELTLHARSPVRNRFIEEVWAVEALPRNILSR